MDESGWHGWQCDGEALWIAVDPASTRPETDLVLVARTDAGVARVAVFDGVREATVVQDLLDRALARTGETNAVLSSMVEGK